jgi:hypothetical protein
MMAVSATLRFPFWGRKQENAIARDEDVVLKLRSVVMPQHVGIGG